MKNLTFFSPFLEEIFNGQIVNNFEIEKTSGYAYINNVIEKNKLKNQLSLREVVEMLKNSPLFPLFNKTINSINLNILYKSHTHGLCHIERTTFWAFCLAAMHKLSKQNCYLALVLAMYHDTGRINDHEDRTHGKRSAENLKNLRLNLNAKQLKIAECIIEAHSIPDTEFAELLTKYDIKETKKVRTLFNILKDADGLDRVRLIPIDIDPKYLRTEFSKQNVLSAFTLKQIYDTIQ